MKAILLAGGPAKDLKYVLGSDSSRSLLRFPGGSLLERSLKILSEFVEEVYVVSDDNKVYESCAQHHYCRFVVQQSPGIEGAVCDGINRAYPSAGAEDHALIVYGDIYYSSGFIESHIAKSSTTYEPVITVTRPLLLRGQYLRVEVDPVAMRVEDVGSGSYIFAGIATLPVRSIKEYLCRRGRNMHELIREIATKQGLQASIWLGEWIDMDTPWDYLVATRLELSKLNKKIVSDNARIGRGVVLEGPVYIDDGATVDHYAVIKGPAYIGKNTLIGAHSFIRNTVAVYDNAIVGAYTEVKRSIVYSSATIDSFSYIADSIIGYKAHVASYTITLNMPYEGVSKEIIIMSTHPLEGLKVGSIIAAGSKTRPHTVIEPATLFTGH